MKKKNNWRAVALGCVLALPSSAFQQSQVSGETQVGPARAASQVQVNFFAKPAAGCTPMSVTFIAVVDGGPVSSYFWEFGDGSTSTLPQPTVVYDEEGLYSPKLTVTLPDGDYSKTKTDYVVANDFDLGFHVDFAANPTMGAAPLTVDFESIPPPGTTSLLWSFGDTQTSTESAPRHTYTAPGTYTVELEATGPNSSDTRIKTALVQVGPVPSTIDFTVANADAELGTVYTSGNTHTGGSAWVDYNGDYLPDLFVTNGFTLNHFLFRNEGDGTFEDVSSLVPKPSLALEDAGVLFADIDNDGDSDILVPVDNPFPVNPSLTQPPDGGPNLLYVNNGDGTFSEGAFAAGLVDPQGRRTIAAAFADYDLDGFVDLYMANWELLDLPLSVNENYDRLLHNNGDGSFADVTLQTGVDGGGLDALCVLWFDADMDLYPELYVGNVAYDFCPPNYDSTDRFYKNEGGGVFSDGALGAPGLLDDAWAAMGLDVGDIDNDGDWELYITDIVDSHNTPLTNVLYDVEPNGTLNDNSADVALLQSERSWPCNFADFNRDGWTDLWVGSGDPARADYLYVNRGDGKFSATELAAFTGHESKGGSIADYDGDGDVDIFLWSYDDISELLRNDSTDNRNWLEIKLLGVTSNTDAIGAVARVTGGGITQMRRVSGGDSAHSQSDLIMHFGLGNETAVDVEILWPSGITQNFSAVAADQLVVIDEAAGLLLEELTDSSVAYDPLTETLTVTARSNYGGRTALTADGLGALRYNAAETRFVGVFEGVQRPQSVPLRSSRGGTFELE